MRHRARGRGPRAADDRRAQAALQPPVPLPRAVGLGQAHRRGVPAAVGRARGPRRRRDLPRPVRSAPRRRAGHRGRPRGHSRSASARHGSRPGSPTSAVRAGRDGPVRGAVRRARERRRLRRPRRGRTPRAASTTRRTSIAAVEQPHHPARPTPSATRRRPPTATGWPRSSAPPRAPSGSPRSPACRELVAARPAPDQGWEIALVRHGRLAGTSRVPGRRRPVADASTRCVATGEVVVPGRRTRGERRGVRVPAALARRHRHPPRPPRRHLGLSRARRRPAGPTGSPPSRCRPPAATRDARALRSALRSARRLR